MTSAGATAEQYPGFVAKRHNSCLPALWLQSARLGWLGAATANR
uniref:Uncharacterized protein n=1 Tax=Rheinheimera sp. BAL341 TaxID=1708203 RepID=A0A486XNY9_9GAMM